VRCDTNNKLQDSTPCQNCLHCLIELNIKRVIFSYKNNSFMSCNPSNLTIYHISTGNNYLKKLETHKNQQAITSNHKQSQAITSNHKQSQAITSKQ
jgi:deoxycytidylate deaminase